MDGGSSWHWGASLLSSRVSPGVPVLSHTWLLTPASASWMAESLSSWAWNWGLAPGAGLCYHRHHHHAGCSCASSGCHCLWQGGLTACAAPLEDPGSPPGRGGLRRSSHPPTRHNPDTHLPAPDSAHPSSPGGIHSGWGPRLPPLWGSGEHMKESNWPNDPNLTSLDMLAGQGMAQDGKGRGTG